MTWYQTKSKYRNKSSVYDGYYYASKLEAGFAKELDLRLKAKDIKSWRRQVKIDLRVYDQHICNYYIDFEITHNDDSIEMVECKGLEMDLWKMKWKLTEAIFNKERPDIKLTVVKR
jgi:hypothetical protein